MFLGLYKTPRSYSLEKSPPSKKTLKIFSPSPLFCHVGWGRSVEDGEGREGERGSRGRVVVERGACEAMRQNGFRH